MAVGRRWPDLHPALPLIPSLLVMHPNGILPVSQPCPTLYHTPPSSFDCPGHSHRRHRRPIRHCCHARCSALVPVLCLQMAPDVWSSSASVVVWVCVFAMRGQLALMLMRGMLGRMGDGTGCRDTGWWSVVHVISLVDGGHERSVFGCRRWCCLAWGLTHVRSTIWSLSGALGATGCTKKI